MSLPPLGKPGLRRRRGHRCGWDSADRHAFTLHSSLHECTRKPAQYAGDGGIVISFRTVASWSRPRKDLSSKFRFRLTPRLGSAEPRSGPGHRPTVFPAHRVDAAERGSPCPSDHHSVEAAVTRRTHSSPSDTRNAPTQPVVLTRQRPRRADHQHTDHRNPEDRPLPHLQGRGSPVACGQERERAWSSRGFDGRPALRPRRRRRR